MTKEYLHYNNEPKSWNYTFQSKENIFLIDDAYESFSNLLNYFSGKVISCEPFKKNKEETKEIVSIISRNI